MFAQLKFCRSLCTLAKQNDRNKANVKNDVKNHQEFVIEVNEPYLGQI